MNVERGRAAPQLCDVQRRHTENKGFIDSLVGMARRLGFAVPKFVELKVHLAEDEETGRWYIAESDIPGLRVEAATAGDLIRMVEEVAPDLIELNVAEILENAGVKLAKRTAPKPSLGIKPVFDSPMAVAC